MLRQRVLTALVLLPPVVAIILWGGMLMVFLALLLFVAINYEFASLATRFSWQRKTQFVICALLIPLGYLARGADGACAGALLAAMLLLLLQVVAVEGDRHEIDYRESMPALMLGLCYTGALGTVLVVAADTLDGRWVLWLLLTVIATDTLAYFGGRAIGGPKFAPRISPNKTFSGAVCGLGGAVLGSLLAWSVLDLEYSPVLLALYGVVAGVMAIVGDLVESLVKRIYGAKDSGAILPGHGGVLDRIDALLFAMPLLFFI